MAAIGQIQYSSKNCNGCYIQRRPKNCMTINLHFMLFYTHKNKQLKENIDHGFFPETSVASRNPAQVQFAI
jgi:hypothetical protein